jgi:hypothetical protein
MTQRQLLRQLAEAGRLRLQDFDDAALAHLLRDELVTVAGQTVTLTDKGRRQPPVLQPARATARRTGLARLGAAAPSHWCGPDADQRRSARGPNRPLQRRERPAPPGRPGGFGRDTGSRQLGPGVGGWGAGPCTLAPGPG